MDRQIIYPGQIPLDTDLLNTNKNAMVAIGKLAGAAFGNSPVVNGLAVTPTSPASLNVQVAPGEIYALQNIDSTAYGSLSSDIADQIVKQGILLGTVTLPCAAPTTTGQSINYLIQAAFSEADGGAAILPYYNAANPSQALSGSGNSGVAQPTVRQNLCVVSAVAGPSAATGTQATPAPAANAVGLAVVTVAFGQTGITSANIAPYPGASLVPQSGLASNVAHAIYTKNVSGNTDVTLTAQEAAYPLLTLTGALTGNINVIVPAVSRQRVINNQTTGAGYNVTVKTLAGTGLSVPQGQTMSLYCDGVNVLNESSASLMPAPYADATGTPDAITAGYAVNTTTLYDGYPLALGIATPNATTTPTFAPTLNGIAQTARTIVKYINNVAVPLAPGDLQGDAELRYDLPNTRWVLQNPGLAMSGQGVPYADAAGTADAVTASYAVVNPTLSDGYQLTIGIASPNLTTTPTFAPTLNGVAQTAHTVVKYIGNVAVPLASGDMQGVAQLVYDLPNTRWVLQNPGADMSNQSLPYADATGTSDAVTASYTGVNPALSDGYQLTVGIAAVNATTAPTFAPTLNGIAQTAHTVVKYINNVGVPLAPGDLQGVAQLAYDLPNTRWVLQNPGLAMSGQGVPYADATGTADAVTASYAVVNPTLSDGYQLTIGIASPNLTTTPTFAPTLNGVAQTAHTVVKYIGNVAVPLASGDMQGVAQLVYDLPNTRWVLQNPGADMSNQSLPYADATGTADAVTASYTGVNPALSDGYQLTVGIAAVNATTAPTFAPTLNGVAQTAHTVVKYIGNVGVPLAPGDLQGVAQLAYDLPNTRWVLQNPGSAMSNQSLPYAHATGTSDAVAASYTGVNPSPTDGYQLTVAIAAPNTTTAPTFAPTLNGVAQTARAIVKYINNVGVPLAPGDLQGVVQLAFDQTYNRWGLQNPGTGAVPPGTIIDYAGTSAPQGYLACPTVQTVVSRTAYPVLFAAIGTTWGLGDNSTTFGIPYFPADYAAVQTNGSNVATQAVGNVLSHAHTLTLPATTGSGAAVGAPYFSALTSGMSAPTATVANTGVGANYAAGMRTLKCVKY